MTAPAGQTLQLADVATGVDLALVPSGEEPAETSYLDTFDGRVYRAGGVLSARQSRYEIALEYHGVAGELLHTLRVPVAPAFWPDLPASGLRDAISAPVGVRRLLPRVVLTGQVVSFDVRDRRDKRVARLRVRSGVARPSGDASDTCPAPTLIELDALRGFDSAAGRFAAALAEAPGVESTGYQYSALMESVGLPPEGHSNRVRVVLDAEAPIQRSVTRVLAAFLDQMRLNEQGACDDVDAEFLHDYRVAVRRTRSMLSRLRKVFPEQSLAPFRDGFARLGEVTSPTRDLDVYLAGMHSFRAGFTERDRAALDSFERFLLARHREEQTRLAGELTSPWVQKLLERWGEFLSREGDSGGAGSAPLAGRPTAQVAGDALWKQYRRVRSRGRSIRPDSPAELVHRLRIECKKFRYLLDGFASLYDADGVRQTVATMKQLQDNLGDFNDFEVQRRALRTFARQMAADDEVVAEGELAADTFIALGRLVERMAVGQARERKRFHHRWKQFDTDAVHDFARATFAGHYRGTP